MGDINIHYSLVQVHRTDFKHDRAHEVKKPDLFGYIAIMQMF